MPSEIHFIGGGSVEVEDSLKDLADRLAAEPYLQLEDRQGAALLVNAAAVAKVTERRERGASIA